MKKFATALLSMAAISLAANVQVLKPTGAEFAPDAPNMVQSIVRAAVSQTGNSPVESGADIQLRTNLMTMGSSIVVVCEQLQDGAVVASGKEKASSIDDLDVAIENAVKASLANGVDDNYAATASRQEPAQVVVLVPAENNSNGGDANDNFAHKRPTRNYVSYGLGAALWHNYTFDGYYHEKMSWDQAFVFHYGRIFEVTPKGAITIINNMNMSFGEEWQLHETFLIGGRYFMSTGNVAPYFGLGLGLGLQWDDHYYDGDEGFAIGLATGAELGVVFFRNSAVQLEVGLAWDTMWDGFEAFDRRFGAGSFYVAINY